MQRYFVQETFNSQKELTITGESARHISKVMRMEVGEKVIVVVEEVAYICEILSISEQIVVRQTGDTCSFT